MPSQSSPARGGCGIGGRISAGRRGAEEEVVEACVLDVARPLQADLLGDPQRGGVDRQDHREDLVELQLAGEVERRRRGLAGEALAVAAGIDRPDELDPGPVADLGPAQADAAEVVAALALEHRPGPEAEAIPVGLVFAQPEVAVGGLERAASAAAAATGRSPGRISSAR